MKLSEALWDRIHVIGVDDSGPDGLPERERRLVEAADLLCGGHRQLALFPGGPAERLTIAGDLEPVYERLAAACGRRRAVVLASGDPCFFGIGPLLAERLGRDRVRIHPRASAVSLAFARLGLAWHDATVLSVHGRPIEQAIPAALAAGTLAFLTDPHNTPAVVAQALLRAGLTDCPAFVCERLGGPAERIHELTLRALPGRDFDPLNVLILLRPSPTPSVERAPGLASAAPPLERFYRDSTAEPAFGRPDAAYRTVRGQITKAEVRAVTLAKLEPWRGGRAWDVGAGSGSIAIEMAALMASGEVTAVERDTVQLEALKQNIAALPAGRVHVVAGAAPEALASLPPPDAVFVGGGGSRLAEILRVVAERLRPGGRLVANFALLESLAEWQAIARTLGWEREVSQIAVARGTSLGAGTHLAPLDPVFVTRLLKPGRIQ